MARRERGRRVRMRREMSVRERREAEDFRNAIRGIRRIIPDWRGSRGGWEEVEEVE